MRLSLVALVGLAAFASNVGVDARAIPNGLSTSFSLSARDHEVFAVDKAKRAPAPVPAPIDPVVPKPVSPVVPKPVEPPTGPAPVENPGNEPEPVTPEPVTPPQAPKPPVAPKPPAAPEPAAPSCQKLKRWEKLIGRACTPPPTVTIPSVGDIKAQINNPTGKYIFYSGPGGYITKTNQWINKQIKGNNAATKDYKKLDQSWKDPNWPDQYQMNQPPAVASEFNNRASQAFAEKAEGVVYVLLPKDTTGTNWQKGTVWDQYEWPNLGPGVTKVIRVNPDDDTEEVIKGSP